jgi:hypothetical protein
MDRYAGPITSRAIASLGGLYLVITMDRYAGPKTVLTIVLLGDL